MIDLNNTWCEATEENYVKLLSLYPDCGKFYRIEQALTFDALVIKNNSFSLSSNRMSDLRGDAKQIHLVNGEFQYVETKPKNNFEEYGFKADISVVKIQDSFLDKKLVFEFSVEVVLEDKQQEEI